jgi:hypothetical protein
MLTRRLLHSPNRATAIFETPQELSFALAELVNATTQKDSSLGFEVVRAKDRLNCPVTDGSSVFISAEAVTKKVETDANGKKLPENKRIPEEQKLIDLPISVMRSIIKKLFSDEEFSEDAEYMLPDTIREKTARHAEALRRQKDHGNLTAEEQEETEKELAQLEQEEIDWTSAWTSTFCADASAMPRRQFLSKQARDEVQDKLEANGGDAEAKNELIQAAYLRQTARRYCSEFLQKTGGQEDGTGDGTAGLFKKKIKDKKDDDTATVHEWLHAAFNRCDDRFRKFDDDDTNDAISQTPAEGSLLGKTYLPAVELVRKLDNLYLFQDARDKEKRRDEAEKSWKNETDRRKQLRRDEADRRDQLLTDLIASDSAISEFVGKLKLKYVSPRLCCCCCCCCCCSAGSFASLVRPSDVCEDHLPIRRLQRYFVECEAWRFQIRRRITTHSERVAGEKEPGARNV